MRQRAQMISGTGLPASFRTISSPGFWRHLVSKRASTSRGWLVTISGPWEPICGSPPDLSGGVDFLGQIMAEGSEVLDSELDVGSLPGGFKLPLHPLGFVRAVLPDEGLVKAKEAAGVARVLLEVFSEHIL